jgi:CHAD domain-containing protein
MAKHLPLLARPLSDGVRRIVDGYLDVARRTLGGLSEDDPETLHDFRVTLRRAHATLRAYGPRLRAVRPKERRRLRGLVRATNAGRDADVLLALLCRLSRNLSREHRADLEPMRRRLRRIRRQAYEAAVDDLRSEFADVRRRLRRRLRRAEPGGITLGEALGDRLLDEAARLGEQLEGLRGGCAAADVHRTRLTVKRLRYLVEPATPDLEEAPGLVQSLRSLQSRLGALHDLDVARTVIETEMGAGGNDPHALREIAARIDTERRTLEEALRRDCLGAGVDDLMAASARLARALATRRPVPKQHAGPARQDRRTPRAVRTSQPLT